jgi:glycosyltransferase involved in cell wall biosynthesis
VGTAAAVTRLLQAMAGGRFGGAEAFFTRLAPALARAGLDQHLVIRAHAARAAQLRARGLGVTEVPFRRRVDLRTGLVLRRLVREWQPQIVLTWMSRATIAMPRGPFVQIARLGGYYDLKYYGHCDHLIGNTRDIVGYLIGQGWPAERAHYLPNFVEDRTVPAVVRASLDTPEGATLVLALGRLHRVKGFDVLLHAVARTPSVHLWLAGDGPERPALERLIRSLGLAGRVRLLGWREDVAALLAAADLLVCPSRHEPLGNVVLEAWAQRVPVIASATEGPRALIAPDKTGLLVPIEDADALAAAIGRLARDGARRRELAEAGYAAFAAEFAEARVTAAYRDLIGRVAV